MSSYYKAVRSELVEIEAVLKAGHVVEPVRGIQFCAAVTQGDDAIRASNNGFCISLVLLLDRIGLDRFGGTATHIPLHKPAMEERAWSPKFLR